MAFDIQRARGSLPSRARQVRAEGIDVRTGGREAGRALAGLGWSIMDLGEKYYNAQATTQLSRAERIAIEEMNRLSLSFEGNLDPETYEQEYQKSLKTIESGTQKILTNEVAQSKFQLFLDDRQPRWADDVRRAQRARINENAIAELFERQSGMEQSGILGDYPEYISRLIGEGIIDKSDGVRLLIKAKHDVEFSQAKSQALSSPKTTLENIEGDKLKGFTRLTPDDIVRIRGIANSTLTQAKLAQEQRDDEIGDGLLELLINKLEPSKPQLTFDAIIDSQLSFGAKTQWLTRLQTFDNYSEQELKEAFTDQGEVLAEIYDKIDNETLTDELDTMVGKGLSPTTAQRIKKEIREPYEARTDKLFKNIFGWQPELGFKNDLSAAFYEKVNRDWRQAIKQQKAVGEEIIDIGRSIARPYFIEHIHNTMSGISDADIQRMVDLALGEEEPKTEPEVPPKEDEGPATMQDFIDEVSRLKKIDEGKAKAFYDAWKDKFEEVKE
jgi:hypothetical protein